MKIIEYILVHSVHSYLSKYEAKQLVKTVIIHIVVYDSHLEKVVLKTNGNGGVIHLISQHMDIARLTNVYQNIT